MKKHIKLILYCSLFFLLAGVTSCKKYLDKEPASTVNPDDAYKNFYNFQGFTEELYNCIPSFCNRDDNNFFNNGEEEMWQLNAANQGAWVWQVDQGNFWTWQKEFGFGAGGSFLDAVNTNNGAVPSGLNTANDKRTKALWPGSWFGIRKANLGLQNLYKLTDATEEEKNIIAGQLYFFRAWFHFELITYWGGLPYISKVLPADQKLTLPRLTYQACADSIAKDFQKAYELLPGNWDDTQAGQGTKNELRINKWMAIAYLGKNYLYAGSPLMNMASGGAEEYNKEYCKKAADAFGILLKAVEDKTCQYRLIPWSNYSDMYYTNGQGGKMPGTAIVPVGSPNAGTYNEAIFRGPNWGGSDQSMNKEYLCAGVLQDRSWSQYATANYVNYFGMDNGLPINDVSKADVDDPTSGYDTHYPWKNRDPRFYINFGFDTQKQVLSSATGAKPYIYANLYTGGNYRDAAKGSNTGYLMMKYDPIGFNKYDNKYNNNQIHVAWLRLGDVYLMYSEAVAKGYENIYATSATLNQDAVWAINKIRNRVKLTDGSDLPGINAKFLGSVENFMSELRRERAVELAYEGHRFNDLRRWHLLAKSPYTLKTGISFDRDVPETNHANPTNNFLDKNVPQNNKINNLKEYVVWERFFSEKHYWLPLKRVDASMYLEFAQNPGW